MDITAPTRLLGGLSPQVFMRRHWQKRPLLIRGAVLPATVSWLQRSTLFALAGHEGVESRLVQRLGKTWSLRHGPLPRRALPRLDQAGWTLLVQGVDLHLQAAHELLQQFRFVSDARLDDLMLSWASDGGGVGPHVDSYDVFLLQVQGQRRWRIGPVGDARLQPGAPLKILRNFVPQQEWLLDPGDMLYLPPQWAHDGVAVGACMTASIGFRAPARAALCSEVLQRMVDAADPPDVDPLYRDPGQPATTQPARIPEGLDDFVRHEMARWLDDARGRACALGELLSEPKPSVVFDGEAALCAGCDVQLDRRTRMLYDQHHVFVNGDAYRAGGRDARLMRKLADRRSLPAAEVAQLSGEAAQLLAQWAQAGWLQPASS